MTDKLPVETAPKARKNIYIPTDQQLAELALEARKNAYASYSGFGVGAALLSAKGETYLGCNIENAAFGAGLCAERTALAVALSMGMRAFTAIAVAGGAVGKPCGDWCPPCGICRQMLREFCRPDQFRIILVRETPFETQSYTLEELLPQSFGPSALKPQCD